MTHSTCANSNCTKHVCNWEMNMGIQTPTDHGIFDSETNEHFLIRNAQMINEQLTWNTLCIILPDGCTTASTHTCFLDISKLPVTAQITQILCLTLQIHLSYLSNNPVMLDTELNMMPQIVMSTSITTSFFKYHGIKRQNYWHDISELVQNPFDQDTSTFPTSL